MRKVNKNIILIIVYLLIFPLIAKADVGAPYISPYEIIVIKEEGTDLKISANEKRTIPYNTVLEVLEVNESDNKKTYYIEYDGDYGLVSASDVALKDEVFNPEGKMDKHQRLYKYVFADDVYIYNGPSSEFSKASEEAIPVGTILNYIYSDDYYIYIQYNGIEGWVYVDNPYTVSSVTKTNKSLVDYTSDGKIYTLGDIEMYKDQTCTEKLDVLIPKNTEVSYQYSFAYSLRSTSYYVNYNGVEGWISNVQYLDFPTDLLIKRGTNAFIYNTDSINIYSDLDKTNIIDTLENNEVINLIYSISFNDITEDCEVCRYNNMNYIEYETGKFGWIDITGILFANKIDNSYTKYELQSDLAMYDKPNGQEVGQVIPTGSILTDVYYVYDKENYESWLYVNYNGINGWIRYDDIKSFNDYSNLETEDSCTKTKSTQNKSSEEKNNEKEIYSRQTVIYAIGGAIVLALTVIVTIVLINRKKAAKNEK